LVESIDSEAKDCFIIQMSKEGERAIMKEEMRTRKPQSQLTSLVVR
jgi:hypothetical protein